MRQKRHETQAGAIISFLTGGRKTMIKDEQAKTPPRGCSCGRGCWDGSWLHKLFRSQMVQSYTFPIWVRSESFNICGGRPGIWTTLRNGGKEIFFKLLNICCFPSLKQKKKITYLLLSPEQLAGLKLPLLDPLGEKGTCSGKTR